MKIKGFLCLILCFLFFASSCSKKEENVSLNEKIIAVEIDSLAQEAANTIKNEVKEIKTFSTQDGAVSAVETKNADFVVLDEFATSLYAQNKRDLNIVKVLPFTIENCIYFNENSELLNKFNSKILELSENGTIENIKEAYKTSDGYYPELKKLSEAAPTLVMATDIAGLPYTDLSESGYVVGIDADIASIIANSLGCNLEIVVTTSTEMFNMLSENKVDFVMSGLMYDSKREEFYDSSLSYLSVEYYLLERDW